MNDLQLKKKHKEFLEMYKDFDIHEIYEFLINSSNLEDYEYDFINDYEEIYAE